jgi:hypothetical protein
MVDVIWWRDDSFWERKSIPLAGFTLSPRQLVIMATGGLLGILVSPPVNVTLFGISFVGKLVAVGASLFLAFIVSSHRVKMAPIEMQVLYRFRGAGLGKKEKGGEREGQAQGKGKEAPIQIETGTGGEQELVVEDFTHPIPYSVAGKMKATKQMKLTLLLDGQERDADTVMPGKSQYWMVYIPRQEDVGTHTLTTRLEGYGVIDETKLTVRRGGVDLLDSKKKKR